MANSTLLKSSMRNAIADSVYNDIISNGSKYYYFLGRVMEWNNVNTPETVVDSFAYEHETRNNIANLKRITQSDVSYVIPRYDWTSGTIYDQYDDQYSTVVLGVDIVSGGSNYFQAPSVTITGTGTGATATCTISNGSVDSVTITNAGVGYTAPPTVTFSPPESTGTTASGVGVIAKGQNNVQKLESSIFYVLTTDFNVYVCIDNNLNSPSTVSPYGTDVDTITTSDGYIWKYMYTLPTSFRNKFVDENYIPVLTALQNQFYSNGSIKSVRIDSTGTGYTSATISVQGDGNLEFEKYYIDNVSVITAGSGYTTATATFDPPVTGATTWVASTTYSLNQNVKNGNNYYTVVVAGTSGLVGTAPTHIEGIVTSGTASFEYAGTIATGTVVRSANTIASVTLDKQVNLVNITSGGSGYTTAPSIAFSGSTGATAEAILQNGSVNYINVTHKGTYTASAITITIGTPWVANASTTINSQLSTATALYTVTAGSGTLGATSPTHTAGSATNGGFTLTYAGTPATATVSTKAGAGYTSIPNIAITGTGTNGTVSASVSISSAKIIPTISGGQIIGVQIIDGGVGYDYANLTITGNGTGTGASLTALLSSGDVNSIQSNVELLTVAGRIMNIPIISGGYNYAQATTTVTISGDGAGCTANAIVVGGRVAKIIIVTQGSGYTWATVSIVDSATGRGATARAILPPFGGHGKNALNELVASSLMFFADISDDKNQGFSVVNEYRQIGIIRNPYKYSTTYVASLTKLSACWVITSATTISGIVDDDILTLNDANSSQFRVVAISSKSILVQSLDNAVPVIGSIFTQASNISNTVLASAITMPTVDKFSGDLLFIDNRHNFVAGNQQSVMLRTIISF